MKLELFAKDDLKYLDELRPEGWSDLTKIHQYYLSQKFCRTVKILIQGTPVGIGTTIKHKKSAWLAHIIVHKNFRGQGVGNNIVENLISYLKSDDKIVTISLIATDLGFPLYKKKGFIEQTEYHFYKRDNQDFTALKISPQIIPYESSMERKIGEIDRAVSGEDRSLFLGEKLAKALVFMKNGDPLGFTIPELGDGLTISVDESAGLELLKLAINRKSRIVFPRENSLAHNFLLEMGYSTTVIARRMIYGQAFSWIPENLYNRIGGSLG